MARKYFDIAIKPTKEVNKDTLNMLSKELRKSNGEMVTELIIQRYGAMIESYLSFKSSVAQAQQSQQNGEQS